jgi:hypothetical protein
MSWQPADPKVIAEAVKRVLSHERKEEVARDLNLAADTITKYMRLMGIEYKRPPQKELHAQEIMKHMVGNVTNPTPSTQYVPRHTGGKRIAVIGDMQVKPDIDLTYCSLVGRYMADKKPDIIVNIGDFADMPSLSQHEAAGSKSTEGARYELDIQSVQAGMRLLMTPIRDEMARSGWNPRLVMTLGNHEHRISRAIQNTPKFEETIGLCDLGYEDAGWEVFPFLQPVTIEGVTFCHYFPSGVMGRPITSARALLTKKHQSCIAGHQQGRDIAFGQRGDGRDIIAIICGSTYEHDEAYLNPQTNNHWRGLYILNDVLDGSFEENAVSLRYLRRKYRV